MMFFLFLAFLLFTISPLLPHPFETTSYRLGSPLRMILISFGVYVSKRRLHANLRKPFLSSEREIVCSCVDVKTKCVELFCCRVSSNQGAIIL